MYPPRPAKYPVQPVVQSRRDNRERWVTIAQLPPEQQQQFWSLVKQHHPEIVAMRKRMSKLIKTFDGIFQLPEKDYLRIVGNTQQGAGSAN